MANKRLSHQEIIARILADREKNKGSKESEPHTSSYAHSASPRRAIGSEDIDATDDPKLTRGNRDSFMDRWGGDRRDKFGFEK